MFSLVQQGHPALLGVPGGEARLVTVPPPVPSQRRCVPEKQANPTSAQVSSKNNYIMLKPSSM